MMHVRWISVALALSALVLIGGRAMAQDEEYEVLNRAGQTITIDADLADWSLHKNPIVLEEFTPWDGGTWNGPDDHSVRFWMLWDDTGLYLAIEVTDDEHINTSDGDQIWNGDGVQVMIDPTGERPAGGGNGAAYAYNFGLGGAKSNKPVFVREFKHADGPAQMSGDIEYAFKRDEPAKKTRYEVYWPKADLEPIDLVVGAEIGFALIVNDGDIGEEGQKGWTGWAENTIVFGKDTGQMNLLILSDEPLTVDPRGKAATTWGALKRTP